MEEFTNAVSHLKGIGVVDRAVTYGTTGGPLAIEIRNALYDNDKKIVVSDFIAGLAGRDVTIDDFKYMFFKTKEAVNKGKALPYQFIGVRG